MTFPRATRDALPSHDGPGGRPLRRPEPLDGRRTGAGSGAAVSGSGPSPDRGRTRPGLPGPRWLTWGARFALVPVLALLALSAWALASPVGASPDEDYHLGSIWCGQGIEQGVCEPASRPDQRKVPESLPNAATCYAFHPDISAQCQEKWFAHESTTLVSTKRGNFKGDYPPVFYFTMHFLVGHDISKSVIAMRLVNAALFVGLVTATYWLLPRRRRTMLLLGTVVVLVPLAAFLIPSINPSSWAITSGALVFPALVGFFETTGRRRIALGGLAVLAAAIGAGARADAATYAALAAVLATWMSFRWRRSDWKLLALPLLIGLACAAVYVTSGQSAAASTGFVGSTETASRGYQLAFNLLNVPSLWAGTIGTWGLGWLDTPMPAIVWVINLATLGAVVYVGIRQTTRRKSVALAVALFAAWAVPTVVLLQSRAMVGSQVQPRYILPLLVLTAQVALFRVVPRMPQLRRPQLLAIATALMVTNAVSLHTNMQRYVTGNDLLTPNLDAHREWWWAIPLPPTAIWLLGAVSFAGAVVLCMRALARGEEQAAPEALEDTAEVTPAVTVAA